MKQALTGAHDPAPRRVQSRVLEHCEQSTVQYPETNSESWDVHVEATAPTLAAINMVTTRDALFTIFFMPPPGFAGLETRRGASYLMAAGWLRQSPLPYPRRSPGAP
ncbi:hypothetical protein ACN28S_07585 [Cystobacter fuscus]